MSTSGKIMGLDIGKRRVGVAVTDELGITAQPLPSLQISGLADLISKITPLIEEYNVIAIVLGYPSTLEGKETDATGFVTKAKSQIEKSFGLEVHLYDERFTSKIAQQTVFQAGHKLKKKKHLLDSISAVLILTDYLSHAEKNHI
jgi:putative Holliday junction resolvase